MQHSRHSTFETIDFALSSCFRSDGFQKTLQNCVFSSKIDENAFQNSVSKGKVKENGISEWVVSRNLRVKIKICVI